MTSKNPHSILKLKELEAEYDLVIQEYLRTFEEFSTLLGTAQQNAAMKSKYPDCGDKIAYYCEGGLDPTTGWTSVKSRKADESNIEWAARIYTKILGGSHVSTTAGGAVSTEKKLNDYGKDTLDATTASSLCGNPCYWYWTKESRHKPKYMDKIRDGSMCDCTSVPASAINFPSDLLPEAATACQGDSDEAKTARRKAQETVIREGRQGCPPVADYTWPYGGDGCAPGTCAWKDMQNTSIHAGDAMNNSPGWKDLGKQSTLDDCKQAAMSDKVGKGPYTGIVYFDSDYKTDVMRRQCYGRVEGALLQDDTGHEAAGVTSSLPPGGISVLGGKAVGDKLKKLEKLNGELTLLIKKIHTSTLKIYPKGVKNKRDAKEQYKKIIKQSAILDKDRREIQRAMDEYNTATGELEDQKLEVDSHLYKYLALGILATSIGIVVFKQMRSN